MPVPKGYVLETPSSMPKGYVLDDAAPPPPAEPDFTKGEGGFYKMISPNQEQKDIPYSNVMKAAGAGYKVKSDERERYASDRRAEVLKTNPKISDPDYIKAMQLPEAVTEKPGAWGRIENYVQQKTEPTSTWRGFGAPPAGPNPALLESEANVAKRVGRVLFGIADMAPQAWSALKDSLSADPQKAADGEDRLLSMHPGTQVYNRLKEVKDDWHRDPALAAENVAGDAIGMWLADKAMAAPGKAFKNLSEWRSAVQERYRPTSTRVAGVSIPVSVGEETPDLDTGRKFTELKSRGVNAPRFKQFEARQQVAVREVIRRTAQEVAGRVASSKEPAAAMTDAAEATFENARPIYKALDGTMTPGTFDLTSTITKQAIARAKKLGLTIDLEPTVVDVKTGLPVGPGLSAKQIKAGIGMGSFREEIPAKQPLTTFVKVISELKKMQRMSADPAMRYAIGQDIEGMNATMDSALRGTPQAANWAEAGRLWRKGYALRSVAKELGAVAKGTPPEAQSPALGRRPTKLRGESLVTKLNKLASDGTFDQHGKPAGNSTLEKAFTPDQIRNLREAADILDQAQSVRVGKDKGKGLAHAIAGNKGPLYAAGAGMAFGALRGGLWEAVAGAVGAGTLTGLGYLLRNVGENWLAEAMTEREGVVALKAAQAAKTQAQLDAAIAALRAAGQTAAASSAAQQQTKTLQELKSEAARRRPAGSQNADLHP